MLDLEAKLIKTQWLYDKENLAEPRPYVPYYGDVTVLNTKRTILGNVGIETMKNLTSELMDLLDTSVAIYEKNGDYAYGVFNSGWCQLLDASSRKLCNTDDNKAALSCGRWLCHDDCWNNSAKAAIQSEKSTDISCVGGIHLYAEPIFLKEEVIGIINIGYGNPPTDYDTLKKLSEEYKIDFEILKRKATAYIPRPDFFIELAKKRLKSIAKLIGVIVTNKKVEDELKLSENFLRETGRMAKVGGWEIDLKNLDLNWTEETYRIHEVTLQEKPSYDEAIEFFPPDDRQVLTNAIEEAIQDGKPYDLQLRFTSAKGKKLWVRTICKPITSGNKTVKLRGTFQDISEFKKAEQALKKSENRFKSIVNESPFPIAVTDKNDEIIQYWSRSAKEMFGYSPKTVSEWYELAYPDAEYRDKVIEQWRHHYKKALETGRATNTGEYKIVCKDGSVKICELYIQIITNNLIVTINDITEHLKSKLSLKESKTKLQQLNADKDRFISILGHDLKSPFNNLLGLSELLIEDIHNLKTDEIEGIIKNINKSATITNKLLEDILTWARAQQGKIPFNPQNMSFEDICKNTLETFNPTAHSKSIKINYSSADPIDVFADADMLKSVLRNLVSNAIKFTYNGGIININAKQTDSNITISVSDNGIGISHESLAKLFDISEVLTTKGTMVKQEQVWDYYSVKNLWRNTKEKSGLKVKLAKVVSLSFHCQYQMNNR